MVAIVHVIQEQETYVLKMAYGNVSQIQYRHVQRAYSQMADTDAVRRFQVNMALPGIVPCTIPFPTTVSLHKKIHVPQTQPTLVDTMAHALLPAQHIHAIVTIIGQVPIVTSTTIAIQIHALTVVSVRKWVITLNATALTVIPENFVRMTHAIPTRVAKGFAP